jgi:hypothetical protein
LDNLLIKDGFFRRNTSSSDMTVPLTAPLLALDMSCFGDEEEDNFEAAGSLY